MDRYVLEADQTTIEEEYGISSDSPSLFEANYNVLPGTTMPIVLAENDRHKRRAISAVWGIDNDSDHAIHSLFYKKVLDNEHFEQLMQSSPCIIPASGFYKWKQSVDDPLPFFLRVLTRDVLSIAGICTADEAGKTRFAALTMPANALVEPLDTTMPLILDQKDIDRWLSGEGKKLLESGPSGNHLLPNTSVFRVPDLVNDPAKNSRELIQPIPKLRNKD